MPQNLTTPDRLLSNPLNGKGFCEPQQYKCALDRCNSGHESLELNIEMHSELILILRSYSDTIEKWAEKSKKRINSSKESSTTRQAWRDSILAAKKHIDRNTAVANEIEKTVVKDLKSFKSRYGKSLVGVQKSKEFESKFKSSQDPWLETVKKTESRKHDYYAARRKLDEAKVGEEATKRDVSSTEDAKRKAAQEVERRERKLDEYKRKYHSSLDGITQKKTEYEKDMFNVLKETDEFEKARLEQVRASFTALKTSLSIEHEKYQNELIAEFDKAIALQQIDKDLEHFDTNYGNGTKSKTKWPSFEEIKD